MDIQAEFESVDIADIVCTNIKNNVPGIHRISITDRGFPTPYGSSVRTIISQGVNNVQPYVTEISQPSVPCGTVCHNTAGYAARAARVFRLRH